MKLPEKAQTLLEELKQKLKNSVNQNSLAELRAEYWGKKGKLKQEIKKLQENLSQLDLAARKEIGAAFNYLQQQAKTLFTDKEAEVSQLEKAAQLKAKQIAVKLPGQSHQRGRPHPIVTVQREILHFFNRLGFLTVSGPELETDYYNFEALNIPAGHPARREQDSFYFSKHLLLRTQTSPMQIRVMENNRPPLAIVSPGKVYRRDTLDATHSYFFHQIEGLVVDREVSFTHLKGLLIAFCKAMFGSQVRLRFRPDYFPFTEPSCEIAIAYPQKPDGWLEVLGAGMVNPLVLQEVGLDPEQHSALAFGLGVERIAMLKYDINDIRLFYENDFNFLKQFS